MKQPAGLRLFGERWRAQEPAVRRARIALAAALAGLLCALALLPTPWSLPGAPALVPPRGQSLETTALVASWWAAVANAVLVALLLLTAPLWARAGPSQAGPRAAAAPISRTSWALFLAAAALAGALRWHLAHSGVAWDEVWTVVHTVVGDSRPAPEDPSRLVFHPAGWRATLWHYKQPTNHPAYSVAARLSTRLWQRETGAGPAAFSEFALRLPSFAAALAAVVMLGVLVHALGFPRAAPAAAFLLAIHPWAIRHGADGRGYSFVVLLTALGAWLLLRALRDGRFASWLAFAGSELALLWTFPLAVYVPLGFFVASVAVLARRRRPDRALQLARVVVANLLAGMIFLQLMAPILVQIPASPNWDRPAWLSKRPARNLWAHVAVGMRERLPKRPKRSDPTVGMVARAHPWFPALVFAGLPALALAGLLRTLRRRGSAERAVALALAVSPVLVLLLQATVRVMFVPRFAIPILVPFVADLAIGLEGLLVALAPEDLAFAFAPCGLLVALASYQAAVAPRTLSLLRYPYAGTRDAAEYLARVGAGPDGRALRAGFGKGAGIIRVYDAFVPLLGSRDELVALVDRAGREGRPLYVFYAYESATRRESPDVIQLVDDRRLFEKAGRFDAIDGGAAFRVVRWTGAPIDRAATAVRPGLPAPDEPRGSLAASRHRAGP